MPRKLKKDLAELLRTHVLVLETRIGSVRYPGLYAPQRASVRKVRASLLPLLVPKICIFFSFDQHEHDCATYCAKIVPTVTYAIRDTGRSKKYAASFNCLIISTSKNMFPNNPHNTSVRNISPGRNAETGRGTRSKDDGEKRSIAARNRNYYIYSVVPRRTPHFESILPTTCTAASKNPFCRPFLTQDETHARLSRNFTVHPCVNQAAERIPPSEKQSAET